MIRFALLLALILAGCMPGDNGANPGPPHPYCSYQNVPGCTP